MPLVTQMPDLPPPESEATTRFVVALVDLGREQLKGQLDGSTQWDTKALGLLTALGVFGSFVVANRGGVGQFWVVPLVLSGAGVIGCLFSLFGRDYDKGPNIRDAYEAYSGSGPEPLSFLVAELEGSVRRNLGVARWKSVTFGLAALCLVLALMAVGISAVWSTLHS